MAIVLYYIPAMVLMSLLSNENATSAVWIAFLVAVFAGSYVAARRASNWTSSCSRALIVGVAAELIVLAGIPGDSLPFPEDILDFLKSANTHWRHVTAIVLTVPVSFYG